MILRTKIYVLLAAAAFLAPAASAQVIDMKGSFLRQEQKRDSVLIGDQLDYGVKLESIVEGTSFRFEDFSKGFMDSVEVVSPEWQGDTLKTWKEGGKKLFNAEFYVKITSFEEGSYLLRPLSLLRRLPGDSRVDTLVFDPQSLQVKTFQIDTAAYKPHDIKGQIRYPLTFKELLPYMGSLLILAFIAAALIRYLRKRRGIKVGGFSEEPAHITALRKLDHWRGSKYWAPDKQKQFYSGVTDTLREYMAARYGIDAMESTTAEIFADLKDKDIPRELFDQTKKLFETSDFVKFAKMTVSDEDNAKVLPTAVKFVTDTYQTEVDAEAGTQGPREEGAEHSEAEKPEEDNSRFMPHDNV